MSAEAMTWAWQQELPPTRKLVLMALAEDADSRGLCQVSQRELYRRTGLKPRAIRDHLRALDDQALLAREPRMRLEDGGQTANLYRLPVQNPLAGEGDPLAALDPLADPPDGSPSDSPSLTPLSRSRSSTRARDNQLMEELRDAEVPDEMVSDARTFLREGRKVDRHQVTPAELARAAAALAEFNRQSGYDYGLGAHLTGMVMRIREHPSWDPGRHVRLVQSAFRFRWWEKDKKGKGRRPTPAVVYGERCFEQVIQDAVDEAAGRVQPGRRYRHPGRRGA